MSAKPEEENSRGGPRPEILWNISRRVLSPWGEKSRKSTSAYQKGIPLDQRLIAFWYIGQALNVENLQPGNTKKSRQIEN